MIRSALTDRSYWLLHAGFFTCGFHVALIVTHLPGEVALWSLPASVASWSLAVIGLGNIKDADAVIRGILDGNSAIHGRPGFRSGGMINANPASTCVSSLVDAWRFA